MLQSKEQEKILLKILPIFNEKQRRLYVAKEAMFHGRGGIKYMNALTGISRPTIIKGIKELRGGNQIKSNDKIRLEGGGRKRIEESNPAIEIALKNIMEETTAGDPMSALRWTCKSTTRISEELNNHGHKISQPSVYRKLLEMGYSLQMNVKNKEGTAPANRDEQFQAINAKVKTFLNKGYPVISVDTKKKELIGEFKNDGKKWAKRGDAQEVNVYDYPSLAEGKAIPYGSYDVGRNEGFVNVGMNHDTAEFAVNSIRRWWNHMGRLYYSDAKKLLICADGGGSNGSRNKAWKYYLQRLTDELGIEISVCHYPPGTSKWNKIEHRLFSYISLHWQGEPLISYETVVNLIGSTTTKKGLRVKAKLDKRDYKKGRKISEKEMDKINIKYEKINPKWNYTIKPNRIKNSSKSKSYFE